MEWNIEEGQADGYVKVVVSGDFDLYHAPAFAQAITARMNGGTRKLRFDLSRVAYLDSSGVGAIIKIVQTARRELIDLRFTGIAGSPRKVLRMSNILPLLHEDEGAVAQ
ncbi:MAG: STAS domain-containing protein [Treponemataceae bacterium]